MLTPYPRDREETLNRRDRWRAWAIFAVVPALGAACSIGPSAPSPAGGGGAGAGAAGGTGAAARAAADAADAGRVVASRAAVDAGAGGAQAAGAGAGAAVDATVAAAAAAAAAAGEATARRAARRADVAARFGDDADAARQEALALFDATGDAVGVERDHMMDGGYRGMLHLVPALPAGKDKVHLDHVAHAAADYDRFFGALAPAVDYRWRDLDLLFFRSVNARTPSAYAAGWTVAYNVAGSLNYSDDEVRETLFHEVFHLNDEAHGDWSARALAADYDAIVKKCGADTACLTPYAPNRTKVRGGTYYAFQPGNDVREYAAELAVRYYREQRGALGQGPKVDPRFVCGRPENRRAWAALVHEFFRDVDRAPPCAP